MINLTIEDLEIDYHDSEVITEMKRAKLFYEQRYAGPVIVLAGRMYELNKERVQLATKLALLRMASAARNL